MKKSTNRSLAEWYYLLPHTDPRRPRPLRRDQLGRLIFEDGSHLSINAAGSPIFGVYDIVEWHALEISAENLGHSDRINRRKMRKDYLAGGARYAARIRAAYRRGFFSVPSWSALVEDPEF